MINRFSEICGITEEVLHRYFDDDIHTLAEKLGTGFFRFLLPNYTSVSVTKSPYDIQRSVTDVRKGDVDSFLSRLQTFFGDIPY